MQVERAQLAAFVTTVRVTEQLRGTVASHQRTLQVLVGLTAECPRTMWLYPKKRSLRNWLSDPAGMLLRDTLMLVVVCPETLCMVPCGPDGLGWEVASPKKWVKKWGPALLCGIQALQLAVLADRVIGLPFPSLPSAAQLGVSTSTVGFWDGYDAKVAKKALSNMWNTISALGVEDSLSGAQEALETGLREEVDTASLQQSQVLRLSGAAYSAVETFSPRACTRSWARWRCSCAARWSA
jgi:hypothetical protein